MARRSKQPGEWRTPIDQSVAGEATLAAAAAGQRHILVGFFIVPDADGTFSIQSDTAPGGAGVETSHTGVCKMKDGAAVGFRSDPDEPAIVGLAGEALVLETVTGTVSGFAYGYTEGE